MKELAVLYSGGSDSTCAVVLSAGGYDRVHLVTFRRFGISCVEHTDKNIGTLKERFGADKFVRAVVNFDDLFRKVSYGRYFHYLKKYGFFSLTTCGLCKTAMHISMIRYCKERGIGHVCDGSNRHSGGGLSPDQVPELVDQLRALYARHGIEYSTPVFDFDEPHDIGWVSKFHGLPAEAKPILEKLYRFDFEGRDKAQRKTTGRVLYEQGILPQENVKGSATDRAMQARCFQVILNNLFVYGYFVPKYGEERYRETVKEFYREKIADAEKCADRSLVK